MQSKAVGTEYVPAQAQHLQEWVEARKRERRVQIVPRTETRETIEMARLEWAMTRIGLAVTGMTVILFVALLAVNTGRYFGWW